MNNRSLSLSLLISAALAIPSLAMAAPVDMATADMNAMPENTLQEEIEGPDGELLATQPGEVESNESATTTEVDAETQALYDQYNDPNYQSPAAEVDSSMPTDMNDQMPEDTLEVQ